MTEGNIVTVGDRSATIQNRRRGDSVRAARYEGWLLEKYPEARGTRMSILALPKVPDGNALAAQKHESQLAQIMVQHGEAYEQATWIADFAVLAARISDTQLPGIRIDGEFTRENILDAYLDYLADDAETGFWSKVITRYHERDTPVASSTESGADPESHAQWVVWVKQELLQSAAERAAEVIPEPTPGKMKLFHPLTEVQSFYPFWKLSGYTITRDGKSWDDQDPKWLNDLISYHNWTVWAEQEVRKDKKP